MVSFFVQLFLAVVFVFAFFLLVVYSIASSANNESRKITDPHAPMREKLVNEFRTLLGSSVLYPTPAQRFALLRIIEIYEKEILTPHSTGYYGYPRSNRSAAEKGNLARLYNAIRLAKSIMDEYGLGKTVFDGFIEKLKPSVEILIGTGQGSQRIGSEDVAILHKFLERSY